MSPDPVPPSIGYSLNDSVFHPRTKINTHVLGSYSAIYREVNWTQELKILFRSLVGNFFFLISQTGNNLGFAGHIVSIATIQLCNCGKKVAIDDM